MDDWWQKMVFSVRRVWFAVAARAKASKNGPELLKLRGDIQTCGYKNGYKDVLVMWEMLRGTESELTSQQIKRNHNNNNNNNIPSCIIPQVGSWEAEMMYANLTPTLNEVEWLFQIEPRLKKNRFEINRSHSI